MTRRGKKLFSGEIVHSKKLVTLVPVVKQKVSCGGIVDGKKEQKKGSSSLQYCTK